MIDLGLNQYKIKEIKYEVKENKIVTFKLHNFNLEDVTIEEIAKEETPIEDPDYQPFSSTEDYKKSVGQMDAKELGKHILNYLKEEHAKKGEHPFSRKIKELHDYKPFSCLKNEKGMQEALEASRKKEWVEDMKKNPSTPTETGNSLVPGPGLNFNELNNEKVCASKSEIIKFNESQVKEDKNNEKRYQNKTDKKIATDLVRAKKIIDEYVTQTSDIEKKRFEDRVKDKYFKLDPDDDFSKIKSLGDLNNSLIENSKQNDK